MACWSAAKSATQISLVQQKANTAAGDDSDPVTVLTPALSPDTLNTTSGRGWYGDQGLLRDITFPWPISTFEQDRPGFLPPPRSRGWPEDPDTAYRLNCVQVCELGY